MPATTGRGRRAPVLAVALAAAVTAGVVPAQDPLPPPGQRSPRDLTALLPADTLAVLDLVDGAACYEALLDFAQPWPESLPAFARLLPGAFGFGVRAATGLFPADLLDVVTPGQVVFAVVPSGGAVATVLLSRIEDERAVESVLRRLRRRRPALQSHVGGGVLTLASGESTLRALLDLRRRGGPRLSGRADDVRTPLRPGTDVRLHLDLAGLRRVSPRRDDGRLWQRTEPGARLFFGPIAWALDRSERLDATLRFSADAITLDGVLDGSALAGDGPAGLLLAGRERPRPLPAAPRGAIATLRLDRSLRAFFEHVDGVLEEAAAAQVKAGLSTAGALIGGGSILEDLMPGLGEPWTVFAVADEGADRVADPEDERPRIQLPSLVLVAPLRDERAGDLLVRFASTLSLINASERGRRGKRPFLVRQRKRNGSRVLVAQPPEWFGRGAPPMEHGLSPTLWLTAEHVVLATTEEGARRAVESLRQPAERVVGDVLRLRGSGVADYLRRNRDVMATNQLLKEGGTLAAARAGIDVVTAIAGALESLEIRLQPGADNTELRARLTRSRP